MLAHIRISLKTETALKLLARGHSIAILSRSLLCLLMKLIAMKQFQVPTWYSHCQIVEVVFYMQYWLCTKLLFNCTSQTWSNIVIMVPKSCNSSKYLAAINNHF